MRSERGNALVEFAIIAPLLFTLLFGMVVLGLGLYAKSMVLQAASQGARVYALTGDQNQAQTAILNAMQSSHLPWSYQGQTLFDPNLDVAIATDLLHGDGVIDITYRQPIFVHLPFLTDPNNPNSPWMVLQAEVRQHREAP